MFFELSARVGTNITLTFNEIAKKLTGIETNPIHKSEIRNPTFNLGAASNSDGTQIKNELQPKKKKKWGC